jgi:hypothetical protein
MRQAKSKNRYVCVGLEKKGRLTANRYKSKKEALVHMKAEVARTQKRQDYCRSIGLLCMYEPDCREDVRYS